MADRRPAGAGLYGYERALQRAGFVPVAGADEAGRGACAGPLVAAAMRADRRRPIAGLNDSKKLTARPRERLYDEIVEKAVAWSVVGVEPAECDDLGMHVANLERAAAGGAGGSTCEPDFVLTDGFPVDGLGGAGLAMWKGDAVAACVAAASIVAKVTRDRIMAAYAGRLPGLRFDVHKGYCTPLHQAAPGRAGAVRIHRMKWDNVARTVRLERP